MIWVGLRLGSGLGIGLGLALGLSAIADEWTRIENSGYSLRRRPIKRYVLGVSVEHGANGLDLVVVELSATEATQDRHSASDLSVYVARVRRYQHLLNK